MLENEAFGRLNRFVRKDRIQNSPFPRMSHFIRSAQGVQVKGASRPGVIKFRFLNIGSHVVDITICIRGFEENAIRMIAERAPCWNFNDPTR